MVVQSHPLALSQTAKDKPDATLTYRLLPNATLGPILSIRAFEFESLYGLDFLISDQQDDKQTIWVTAC